MKATRLNFRRSGPSSGPTLLLIPPMGTDHRFWDECRNIWQERYHCIAVDLRGSGNMPQGEQPLTIDAHANDLSALKDLLELGAVVPVGCAIGAMVAVVFAARHAADCTALVLSNPGLATQPQAREMLARRAEAVRRAGMDAILPGAVNVAFEGCTNSLRRTEHLTHLRAVSPEAYATQIENILDADVTAHLSYITCPTLLVAGGCDRLLPPIDHAHKLHAMIDQSEFVEISEAAHFIPYQRPEEFAIMVLETLDRACQLRSVS